MLEQSTSPIQPTTNVYDFLCVLFRKPEEVRSRNRLGEIQLDRLLAAVLDRLQGCPPSSAMSLLEGQHASCCSWCLPDPPAEVAVYAGPSVLNADELKNVIRILTYSLNEETI